MGRYVQTYLSSEEFKKVKIKTVELDKEIRDFAKEALLEKCDREEQKQKEKE